MRYILTKDNTLYDLESKKISSVEYIHTEEQLKEYGLEEPCYSVYYYSEDEGQHLERDGKGGRSMDNFYDSEIVKQANDIEDLIDAVIETKGHTGEYVHYLYQNYERYLELKPKIIDDMLTQDFEVYGAIWTSKGLEYVVKMNNKGEFKIIEED